MATKQVTIPDIGLVTMYKRRGNRSLRLSIGSKGEVRVSLPAWVPYKAAEEFVKTKRTWIEANQSRQTQTIITNGQHIGKNHRIYFTKQPGAPKITTRVLSTEIYITHPAHIDSSHESVQAKAHSASIRALRQEAEKLLPQRLDQLAVKHGFTYRSVSVKQLKSRWGSCSSRQEITLNLYLMQLPWYLIDYVLMHELTHTKIMRHGPPFWEELESHMPTAKGLRKEINTHQPILTPKSLTVA